jgi:DNA phosphorothioation-dependent restriction protein DptG
MTDTEHQLHAALVALEAAARPETREAPRPNLQPLFERIDALTAALPADADRQLRHFLERKTYAKAREWLEDRRRTGTASDIGG